MKLTLNEKALLQNILRDKFDKTKSNVTCQNIIEIAKKTKLPNYYIDDLISDYKFVYK
jgi:hypothetical protein